MNESSAKPQIQILHFLLSDIRVCVDIQNVNKVLPLMLLETIPGSPPYLVGLMNLAGVSIPVIDLSLRLGLNRDAPYSIDAPILLCSDGNHQAGIIVDKILRLDNIDESNLQMRNEFNKPNSPFLAAVKLENELSLLINMKRILAISLMGEKSELTVDNKLTKIAKYEYE